MRNEERLNWRDYEKRIRQLQSIELRQLRCPLGASLILDRNQLTGESGKPAVSANHRVAAVRGSGRNPHIELVQSGADHTSV
jgi:hypothetical protein